MIGMYVRFKILAVKPLIGQKAIVLEATHEIDPLSVTPASVRITNPGDPLEELLWNDFSVDGKTITLFLTKDPLINQRYVVRIQGLKNIIEDTLETDYKQTIVFKSVTTSEIYFVTPELHSVMPRLKIEIGERLFNESLPPAAYLNMQVSSDPLFQKSDLLLLDEQINTRTLDLHLKFQGQIFIRCRAYYSGMEVLGEVGHFGDWITTTCTLDASITAPEIHQPVIERMLEVVEKPADNQIEQHFAYGFDVEEITYVEKVVILAKPIASNSNLPLTLTHQTAMVNHLLMIMPDEPLPENCLITVKLTNVHSDNGLLASYTHQFYSLLTPCYADLMDIQGILEFKDLDPQMVYYHLIEASKLADYYTAIKLNGTIKNRKYYNKVPDAQAFEKAMFVKYYTANQVLSQIRSQITYNMSLSGKLGEIEYSPKASLPDLLTFLNELANEAKKWKLALQGYKDHPADYTSAIKSKACLPHNHYRGGR